MNHEISIASQIAFLAIQIGIIIFAARCCGKLAQRLHIPSVLGELLAGIIIGPYLLGAINLGLPGMTHGLFPLPTDGGGIPVSTPLYALATLGSIILLFMSGLETDLRMFFRYSVAGTVIGLGGVIFSFIFGAGLGMTTLHAGLMDPRCLFLGILCTATSVGITARILSEKKSIDSPEGTTILAAAVIDDVLGIICLAVVMGIVGVAAGKGNKIDWTNIELIAIKSVGIWLGVTAIGLAVAHRIAKLLKFFKPSGSYSMLAFALALLLAGFFEQVGLAMIVGAYVMGLSLSKTDISFAVQRTLRSVYDFLVPIFFVVMGMLVDVRVLGDSEVLKFGLIYSLLAIAAKLIGCALPAFFMNFNFLGSLRIGAGMIPRGEVALIIAGIGATTMVVVDGVRMPIIDAKLFGVAIIMTLVTTLAAPPLLALMLALPGKGVRRERPNSNSVHTKYMMPSELVGDFILRLLIDSFRHEGFRHSEVDRENALTHFRREGTTFTLQVTGNEFDFESNQSEVTLIKTVMYETFVALRRNMGALEMLVTPPDGLRRVVGGDAEPGATTDKIDIKIERIIPAAAVLTDLQATSTAEAIRELVGALAKTRRLTDVTRCIGDVLEREVQASTWVGNGIALPHARTDGVRELAAAIGISRNGFHEFGATGETIHIVVLSVCPRQADRPYLQFIAHIAKLLSREEYVQRLLDGADVKTVIACLGQKPVSKKNITPKL